MSCSIFLGQDFFSPSLLPGPDWFIITDSTLHSLYSSLLHSWNFPLFILPSGELYKTRSSKSLIEDFLLSNNCKKTSGLIAFGGGVVTDLTGFVASTYMRGIQFVSVPTSLLAMVDSSVGGKNAVDTPYGKNLIGTIYRPLAVYIDSVFLETLPDLMWSAGISEVIKIAAILDRDFYEILRGNSVETMRKDCNLTMEVIKRAVQLKKVVVEQDEKESQRRMILNFGHTVGHAVEAEMPGMNHGLCVSIGMYCELAIARYLGRTEIDLEDFKEVLESYGLPYKMPRLDPTNLYNKAKVDKKRRTSEIPIYVPVKLGCIEAVPILVPERVLKLFFSSKVCISGELSHSEIQVPGSKSITNRYLLLSALSKAQTLVKSALISEDTSLMIKAIQALGICKISSTNSSDLQVTCTQWEAGSRCIYVGNAGTVARFLAMTCTLIPGETTIRGSARMHQRPIKDLVDAINSIEPRVFYLEQEGYLPVLIKGGGFLGGQMSINCSTSSQYVSSILMAAPLASSDTELLLLGKSEPTSLSYINLTIHAMKEFGAQIEVLSPLRYLIRNTGYRSPGEITVEADAGSASYFFALAALHMTRIRVPGLGCNSPQGELEFVGVLRQMGCAVVQTLDYTEVNGEGVELRPVAVDMNNCTDSFITAAVVMATCKGISEIRGIENQRVKECDRITAVRVELGKTGVLVEEIEGGIRIHGGRREGAEAHIRTYDDHRIAMGFAVLGTVLPGIRIEDKDVVDKTFPEFWKTMMGIGFEVDAGSCCRGFDKESTVVIVGMRGVGKTTLARYAGEELNREVVDIDAIITKKIGTCTIKDWVEVNGIGSFRGLEYQVLSENIYRRNCIIATGGGVVEHNKSLVLLQSHYPVIWISTTMDNIERNLEKLSAHRTPLDLSQAYNRRKKLFELVHNYRFYYKSRNLELVCENFTKFLYRVTSEKCPIPGNHTYFGCITEDTNMEEVSSLTPLTALEIRADKYSTLKKSLKSLAISPELIPGVQTIFTYRSPDSIAYWKSLSKSLKFAPDFIDVQFSFCPTFHTSFTKLRSKCKNTRIILSYHSESLESDSEITYSRMQELSPDIIKFISPYKPRVSSIPLLSFQMGEENTITRVQNIFFSPVMVSTSLAGGQLRYSELLGLQHLLKVKPENLKIYLAGNNISRSPGPRLYNSLFKAYGIPLEYLLLETHDFSEVVSTLRSRSCLGMCITIPFKEEIIKVLDIVSAEALAIGSVNTVTKYRDLLIGHNTDWQGLYLPLANLREKFTSACILGAGGTCKSSMYALESLGVKEIVVWNRSAERLKGLQCRTTTEMIEVPRTRLIMNTLPGSVEVSVPWIDSECTVFEAAYFPKVTPLGLQAKRVGARHITGKEMYVGMARHQFMLFTGKNISGKRVREYLQPIFKELA